MSDDLIRALEACTRVADAYGIPREETKPCIATLLDGNLGGIPHHEAAFIIAIETRRIFDDQARIETILKRWALSIRYPAREAQRAAASAFKRNQDGAYRYHPPGLRKDGALYARVLKPLCEDFACPAHCLALRDVYAGGDRGATYKRFCELGWPAHFKKKRKGAAIDVYRALTILEKRKSIPPGLRLIASQDEIADVSEHARSTVRRSLTTLVDAQLVNFKPGSGSGPMARDRRASEITRITPIPSPLMVMAGVTAYPPITNRADDDPHIEPVTAPYIGSISDPARRA